MYSNAHAASTRLFLIRLAASSETTVPDTRINYFLSHQLSIVLF